MKILFLEALRYISVVLALYLCLDCTTGHTIDEIIANSSTDATYNYKTGDLSETILLVELDMLLTVDQYNALYKNQNTFNEGNSKRSLRKKRKAIKHLTKRWTNKRIPYRIEPFDFSELDQDQIKLAIEEWERNTCITFPKVTQSNYNFINFENGPWCSSEIGMKMGKQLISLAAGCRRKRIIVHEIGHAVGFFHEQNRPDRDDYVIIKTENIAHLDYYNNFNKYDLSAVSTYGVPYDYMSIMHYGGKAFSGNGQYTVVTKNPAFQEVIGNSYRLSFNDIKLANLMYNCGESCSSSIRCPTEGFVGKDCQCWCPGDPVRKCEGSSVSESPNVKLTLKPTTKPPVKPTVRSTRKATVTSTRKPTVTSTRKPTVTSTRKPKVGSTRKSKVRPTRKTKVRPTRKPKVRPTRKPKVRPTRKPKVRPTRKTKVKPHGKAH